MENNFRMLPHCQICEIVLSKAKIPVLWWGFLSGRYNLSTNSADVIKSLVQTVSHNWEALTIFPFSCTEKAIVDQER